MVFKIKAGPELVINNPSRYTPNSYHVPGQGREIVDTVVVVPNKPWVIEITPFKDQEVEALREECAQSHTSHIPRCEKKKRILVPAPRFTITRVFSRLYFSERPSLGTHVAPTNTAWASAFCTLLALEPSKTVLVYHTAVQPGLGKLGIEWRDGQMDGQMNDYWNG